MAVQVSSSNKQIASLEDVPQSITYHPSIWGDYFLTHQTEVPANEEEELQKLREEVKKLLATTSDHHHSLQKMELIDAIQRLGVAYHFEEQINESLQHMYDSYTKSHSGKEEEDNDLHTVALRFRLLRQQGYNVSSDVFKKFIDHEGKFKGSLRDNIRGMLSLYEASNYVVHGEEILDEAFVFTSSHLKFFIRDHTSNNSPLVAQVNDALNFPIRKALTRWTARKFISIYQEDESHNKMLLHFAKLDFNFVQKLHKKELSDLTRWWKDLDFKNKLSFARDRMVECYFWALGVYFEPQYKLGREIVTKVLALGSTVDDIYDVKGTLDELKIFTKAIERWDLSAMEELPPYMQVCYSALLEAYAEWETLEETDKPYRVQYAIEEMKKMIMAYFQEAEWLHKKYIPTFDEYIKVAAISAGYIMVAITAFVGMGSLATMEDYKWAASEPLMLEASSLIARLMDDMGGYGVETKFSAVQCYMKQHGASKEDAFDELQRQVWKAWKDMNQECLHPAPASMPILMRVVNSTRVIHFIYKDGDRYTDSSSLKDIIKSVLVEPITI